MNDSPMQRILVRLAKGQVQTLGELAADLDTSVELVEQMLWDLERGGYIREVAGACDTKCGDCPHSEHCGISYQGRLWAVTEKGFRLARRS